MGGLFGKSSPPPPSAEEKRRQEREAAIAANRAKADAEMSNPVTKHLGELAKTRSNLRKAQKHTSQQRDRYDAMIRDALRAGKDKLIVKTLIRQKLIYDKQYEQQATQLENVERMRSDAHSAATTAEVMKAISAGTAAITLIEKDMPIERAQEIMDEAEEAAEYVRELDEAMMGTDLDVTGVADEELDAELDAIQAVMDEAELLKFKENNPALAPVPDTPVTNPVAAGAAAEAGAGKVAEEEAPPRERVAELA